MKALLLLCSVLAFLIAGCILVNADDDAPLETVAAFKAALEQDGFIVQEGQLETVDLIPLCCSGALPSCYANNAGAPYMLYRVPQAPGQSVQNIQPWAYRLRPDEALILIGKTPPEVAYFSYETFLTNRFFDTERVRRRIYACLGDAINNLSLKAAINTDSPFLHPVVLISTADRGIDTRVRAAALAAGFAADIVNTDVIPSSVLRMGLDYESDELSLLHRMALPVSKDALDKYLCTPQTVLRVTPVEPAPLDPFPTPMLRVRGTGTTEMDLMPAVEELRRAIITRYSNLSAIELTTSVWLEDGFDGLQRGIDFYGPTRDALYLWTQPFFQLLDDPDSFLIVYGVNHEAAGKATYSNLSLYGDPTELIMGLAGTNSRVLQGTALDYLPNHSDAHLLYAYKVARQCNGDPNCLKLEVEGCQRLDLDALPDLWVGFRAYLEPDTMVGPAFAEILYDRVIVFSPSR